MTKYKYEVVYSSQFKKGLKKALKQGKNLEKLGYIVLKLSNKEELELKYRNHKLLDDRYYQNCNECHIEPDWLLIYQYREDQLILLLIATGSHSELF